MVKDVKDKLVLITGGAGGIGRLMAFAFARRGARVAVWDVNGEALAALEAEALKEGVVIRGMICDVSDRVAVYAQAAALTGELGPPDILINNAGVVSGGPLLDTPDEKIIRTININVFPLFWTLKAFLPSMIARNTGHIVTISSAAGLIGVRGLGDYCASKFAAFGFDESLRMDLRRMGSRVRTTVVCPFFINTGMFRGVKTRFPLLMPILNPDQAVQRIVRAVLRNRRRLIMPPLIYALYLLRLAPVFVLDMVSDFLGISHSMDDFKGRESL
ncbi:MAG: SDR family oxidoreductase [Treponema sp.]|jgi:all-trans-retinol dehydrogenase (NAD+)|nr:SDR family oxidoreductase [Treponema sp.]